MDTALGVVLKLFRTCLFIIPKAERKDLSKSCINFTDDHKILCSGSAERLHRRFI